MDANITDAIASIVWYPSSKDFEKAPLNPVDIVGPRGETNPLIIIIANITNKAGVKTLPILSTIPDGLNTNAKQTRK